MEYTVNYNGPATVRVFDDHDQLAKAFLHHLSLGITENAGRGNNFHLALSGGSTPMEIFKRTTEGWGSPVLLKRLKIYWGDERCVPPGSDESNYGNARDWLNKIRVPEENIHRIRGESDPGDEVIRYENELKKLPEKNGLPRFDLVILGVGEDGHTASIFPTEMKQLHTNRLVAHTHHPDSGQSRITITGPVINNARNVLFLATGERKVSILKELFSDSKDASSFPAFHIHPEGSLTWYLDKASGGWLEKS